MAASLVAATVVAVAAVPAPAPAARQLGCRPAGSKTIVKSARARVFRFHGLVYGCLYRRGVALALTTNNGYGEDSLRRPTPRLAGRFVAYTYEWSGAAEGVGDSVAAVDLRRGIRSEAIFEAGEDGAPIDVVVNRLTVTAAGWLAWGWTAEYAEDRFVPEIRKLRPANHAYGFLGTLLDSGEGVDPASLVMRERTISWKHGDEQRSAVLG